jgi:HD superfamily phosphohydrolase
VHTARGLSVEERGLEAAESLLVARFAMFSTVYLHKTVRIASRMLQQAIVLAIEDGTLDPKHSLKLTDAAMLDEISHSKNAGELVGRLLERKLYKKAYSIPINEMKMGAKKAEKELSEKCGCSVLLDVPRLSLHTDIMLLGEDGKSSPLSSSSELVRSLESMQKSRLDVLVMCDEADADVVATQSKRYFG